MTEAKVVTMSEADYAKFEKMKLAEDNRSIYNKEYYEQNKERITSNYKEHMKTPEAREKKAIRDKRYKDNNKEKIAARKAKKYEEDKEEINEKRRNNRIECECGLTINFASRQKHYKTKIHLELMSKK